LPTSAKAEIVIS